MAVAKTSEIARALLADGYTVVETEDEREVLFVPPENQETCPDCGSPVSYLRREDAPEISRETLRCAHGHEWWRFLD